MPSLKTSSLFSVNESQQEKKDALLETYHGVRINIR